MSKKLNKPITVIILATMVIVIQVFTHIISDDYIRILSSSIVIVFAVAIMFIGIKMMNEKR